MYLEIFLADFAVFRVFLGISRDFAEIPEFRGSATAGNIRSPVKNKVLGNWLKHKTFISKHFIWETKNGSWLNGFQELGHSVREKDVKFLYNSWFTSDGFTLVRYYRLNGRRFSLFFWENALHSSPKWFRVGQIILNFVSLITTLLNFDPVGNLIS